jgi:hypothetical protein
MKKQRRLLDMHTCKKKEGKVGQTQRKRFWVFSDENNSISSHKNKQKLKGKKKERIV